MDKQKLGDIATVEISGVDKKQKTANKKSGFATLLMSIITGL